MSSKCDARRALEYTFDEDLDRLGQWLSLALRDRGLGPQQAGRQPRPGRGRARRNHRPAKDQSVRAVERNARRVLEILTRRIDYGKIQARPHEPQQRIALHNKRGHVLTISFRKRFPQSIAQWRQALGKKALLGPQPKRFSCAGRQKSRAISARLAIRFPFDGANVLVGSAIAVRAVLRADAVTVLRNLSCNPVRLRKCRDDVAHQLRLADASCVPPDNDHPPLLFSPHVTSLPAWLPTL